MYEDIIRRLEPVQGRVDAVLDTDAFNEIDDQFALAYLLAYPERVNLLAITAAPFFNERSTSPEDGMLKSYDEIIKVSRLCGRNDAKELAYLGARKYLPDGNTPVDSPAARRIAELALQHGADEPLYVVAIGAITNVASALLMEPAINNRIVVVWLGGHSLEWPDTAEFNMRQDVAAARVVWKSAVPLVMLPCQGVVSAFSVSGPEFEAWLIGKNGKCTYLAQNAISSMAFCQHRPWSRVLWDVCAAAYLVNDNERFLRSRLIRAPFPQYDNHYSQTEFTPHPVRYVWAVNRDSLLTDMIERLTRA